MHPNHLAFSGWIRSGALVLAILVAAAPVRAQEGSSKPESPEQLEQIVAPIALYPDALLAQLLMASTYPLEIVEAARWVKAHPGLEGKALEDALQSESWDPSVKSLTAFPQALAMMNDKLDWTTQLGDAFLAQQKSVMNAVQSLRQKAKAEGNLESNKQQTVKVEPQPTGSQTQTIIIESANPQVVYVPTYNPMVVYGPWPYPTYQPFYYYPPGYVATASMVSFGVGLAVGAAVWGDCNWGRSDVNINVNKYNNFNRTNINNSTWKHDGSHRRGASYGNKNLQDRYGGNQARNAQARESFRGQADQGRKQIASGDTDHFKGHNPKSKTGGAAKRTGAGDRRGDSRQQSRQFGQGNSTRSSSRNVPAFDGMNNARATRRNSSRGSASRSGRSGFGGGRGRGGGGGRTRGGGGRRR